MWMPSLRSLCCCCFSAPDQAVNPSSTHDATAVTRLETFPLLEQPSTSLARVGETFDGQSTLPMPTVSSDAVAVEAGSTLPLVASGQTDEAKLEDEADSSGKKGAFYYRSSNKKKARNPTPRKVSQKTLQPDTTLSNITNQHPMSTRHRTNENTQGDEYYAVVIEYIFDHNTCAGEIVFKTIIDKFKYSNIQNETEQCILPGGTKSRSSSLTA